MRRHDEAIWRDTLSGQLPRHIAAPPPRRRTEPRRHQHLALCLVLAFMLFALGRAALWLIFR